MGAGAGGGGGDASMLAYLNGRCQQQHGQHSEHDEDSGSCVCAEGYGPDEASQCVAEDDNAGEIPAAASHAMPRQPPPAPSAPASAAATAASRQASAAAAHAAAAQAASGTQAAGAKAKANAL